MCVLCGTVFSTRQVLHHRRSISCAAFRPPGQRAAFLGAARRAVGQRTSRVCDRCSRRGMCERWERVFRNLHFSGASPNSKVFMFLHIPLSWVQRSCQCLIAAVWSCWAWLHFNHFVDIKGFIPVSSCLALPSNIPLNLALNRRDLPSGDKQKQKITGRPAMPGCLETWKVTPYISIKIKFFPQGQ